MTLRIMPLGDSITRGSYLALYDTGPFSGQPIGLPNPAGGGWRKPLQDKLRAAGVHPNQRGMEKMAEAWWTALQPVLRKSRLGVEGK